MTPPEARPPAPPWETPRSGAGPPVGAGSAAPGGYGQHGYGQYGYDQYGYGQYADFSPPSHELPPTTEAPPVAEVRPPGPAKPKKSGLPWLVAGLLAVVLAAIVLVLGFVVPGSLLRNVFDARGVADGVRQVLRDVYRVDGVRSVSCPAGKPADPGTRFDCQAIIGGESKTVTVTVTDSTGRYEVGHPR